MITLTRTVLIPPVRILKIFLFILGLRGDFRIRVFATAFTLKKINLQWIEFSILELYMKQKKGQKFFFFYLSKLMLHGAFLAVSAVKKSFQQRVLQCLNVVKLVRTGQKKIYWPHGGWEKLLNFVNHEIGTVLGYLLYKIRPIYTFDLNLFWRGVYKTLAKSQFFTTR